MKTIIIFALLLTCATSATAQQTIFVPNCGGDDDTARIATLITRIGSNTGTIRLPYKDGFRCAVNSITFPANVTLDNTDGTGLHRNSGAVVTVLGPIVNPVGKPIFFGPGTTSFVGNAQIGAAGQALLSGGDGTTSWGNVGGGGPGGPTTGSGASVLQTGPTLIDPILGDATAATINNLTITQPATGATLTIADGKTLTVSNTVTFSGTDGTALVLGQPLTVGGAAGVTINGGGTLTLGGFTGALPTSGTFALGAGSVTVSTTNNTNTPAHTHSVTSSANPGPTASLLATNPSGFLQLERLGVGTSPTQPLEVASNALISGATANLFLKDTSTGWQAATTMLINPQPNNSVCSSNFTSGLVGWCINATGNGEFANVDVRGAIRSSVLVFNAVQATAGTLGVFKSAAKLRSDVTIPSTPVYGTSTVNIDVVDQDGLSHASSQLFVVGDILRMKDGLAGDTWFEVASVSDQTTFWRYTVIIWAGSNNVTYRAGLAVVDYGLAGQGFIIQTADQPNAPYIQMATHPHTFTSASAGGTLNFTPRLRIGNLNGSYGYASDTYGFAAGERAPGRSWITVDPTNGVRIGNNTTVLTQIDAAGNASFTGNIAANGGTIAGWAISATRLSAGSGTTTVGLDTTATGGDDVRIFAGSSTPASAPFRVTEAGALTATNATITGAITATSGSFTGAITSTSGTIGGFTITANRISAGSGSTTVGMDSTVTGGDDVRIFAGNATPGSAPFRVTENGVLVASNANITGTITANAGELSGVNITGLLSMSAAGSAITIGTSPPTSASAGTGIWLDRTGLYGLNSNVVQTQVNSTGQIVAGGGEIKMDVNGLYFFSTLTSQSNRIKWIDSTDGSLLNNSGWIQVNRSGVPKNTTMSVTGRMLAIDTAGQVASGLSAQNDINTISQVFAQQFGSAHATHAGQGFVILQGTNGVVASRDNVDVLTVPVPASTAFEVRSTTGALLPPRMTTTQRDALTAAPGMVIYNTTTNKHQGYNGTTWNDFY